MQLRKCFFCFESRRRCGENGGMGENWGKEAELSENTKLRTFVRYQEDSTATLCLIVCGNPESLRPVEGTQSRPKHCRSGFWQEGAQHTLHGVLHILGLSWKEICALCNLGILYSKLGIAGMGKASERAQQIDLESGFQRLPFWTGLSVGHWGL